MSRRLGDVLGRLWQRLVGPPPELTEADVVPAGAEPLCPRCLLPYAEGMKLCPNCGNIVSRWATTMAYVWILVWGPALQRVMRQARLSRLICVGLVLSGADYLAQAVATSLVAADSIRTPAADWLGRAAVLSVPVAILYFAVAMRMWEAVVRAWGSWKQTEDEETPPSDLL